MGIVDSNISSLGLEAAGVIRQTGPETKELIAGDRVFVFGGGCFSTGIVISEKLCVKIPDTMDFEDAATMPCVFSTVIHGLLDIARLSKNDSVLIHSACGGVGIAAIQICKMVGAEIYCTVGSDEKIQYLESSFNIPRERVFNSRDASFLPDILKATKGRGVDVVLNSLSGDLLHASWNCVAEFGKMIEIGKRDLIGNGKLALNVFELNRSYHGVDLGHLIEVKPEEGNSNVSYLLVGGLGGLGRLISNWMVENGARNLVYLSRNCGDMQENERFFDELEVQGCSVIAVRGSVTSLADVDRALSATTRPIRGVINMSMVLRDESFSKMTHEEWTTAVDPKVQGTWNLHNACENAGLDLDFFLLFSSISGVIGQRGQANYAAANTFLDAFVQYRQTLGLKASVVDIGAMIDYGYLADNSLLMERLASQGFYGIKIPQLLDALALVIKPYAPDDTESISSTFVNTSQLVIGHRSLTALADPANRVIWKEDRRMGFYFNSDGDKATTTNNPTDQGALVSFLKSATADPGLLSLPDSPSFIARQIAAQLFRLLLKPADNEEDIDIRMSLQEAGLDSLVAVEMRSWWKTTFGFDISVLEMLGMGSVAALGERALRGLKDSLGEVSGTRDESGEKHDTEGYLKLKMP
ncbi:highly reducing polyketide synthase gloL [Colletotrichum spaethianum]|uniref:Highly reducing polyketide synthase gloL n=1 Tax=Colletotrichum spaethianum TaxID=700344 RepID=A0AA37LAT6_9PEZI|nr:highly reducing polyketide synthase gloL [Colletotrichum spaethianum]GKT45236.1 highly reducing polyketide synthase gloL [Colletotrichum spaethianum]